MLNRKWFIAPALMALALFTGVSGAGATEGVHYNEFFQTENGPEMVMLNLNVPPEQAYGQICDILADGCLVAQFPIQPGINMIAVPMMGSVLYEANAPIIRAKPFQSFGWGIN